jgi:hypothetical protein
MLDKENFSPKDKEAQSIFQFCFDHNIQYFPDRQTNLERYEGIRQKRENRQRKYDHEYISTAGAEMIEQKAAFVTEAVTNSGEKMFDVGTYNNIEVARDAKAASELLNYYMSNIPLVELAYTTHKNLFLYGTAVFEVFHQRITRKEARDEGKIRLKVDADGSFGSITPASFKDVDDLKQPFIRQVRLLNFFPDPQPTDGTTNTCRFICTRQLVTKTTIKRNKDKYGLKNLERAFEQTLPVRDLGEIMKGNDGGLRKRFADYDIEAIAKRNDTNDATKADPICELVCIYRPGTVQYMVNGVVVSDEIIIYPEVRYPFVVVRNQPMDGEFFGRPDLELVKNNIDFYEELVNLIHDKYLLNLKPVMFADALNMDAAQIKQYKEAQAGDVITVDNFNSENLKEMIQTPPDPAAINFAEGFLSEVKKALAINPMMEGQNPGSGIRTEGSLEMFQRIGSTRMQTQLNIIVRAWEEVGRLMLRMAKIFSDRELYLSISGPLGDTVDGWVDPRMLNVDTKFKIKLGAVADPRKDTKVAQMLKFIDVAAKYDQLGLFRMEQALAETSEYLDCFHDAVGLWETDPNVIQARRELMASIAGKSQPSAITGFPSMSEAQSQQPAQEAQPQEGQMPMQMPQASDIPRAQEGVPA